MSGVIIILRIRSVCIIIKIQIRAILIILKANMIMNAKQTSASALSARLQKIHKGRRKTTAFTANTIFTIEGDGGYWSSSQHTSGGEYACYATYAGYGSNTTKISQRSVCAVHSVAY